MFKFAYICELWGGKSVTWGKSQAAFFLIYLLPIINDCHRKAEVYLSYLELYSFMSFPMIFWRTYHTSIFTRLFWYNQIQLVFLHCLSFSFHFILFFFLKKCSLSFSVSKNASLFLPCERQVELSTFTTECSVQAFVYSDLINVALLLYTSLIHCQVVMSCEWTRGYAE